MKLGIAYDAGIGVAKDAAKATAFFKKSDYAPSESLRRAAKAVGVSPNWVSHTTAGTGRTQRMPTRRPCSSTRRGKLGHTFQLSLCSPWPLEATASARESGTDWWDDLLRDRCHLSRSRWACDGGATSAAGTGPTTSSAILARRLRGTTATTGRGVARSPAIHRLAQVRIQGL